MVEQIIIRHYSHYETHGDRECSACSDFSSAWQNASYLGIEVNEWGKGRKGGGGKEGKVTCNTISLIV